MPDNAAGKQRGRPFQKGISGNPEGKPKGTRHRVTLMAEQLMEQDARDVVQAVIDAAKTGDMAAARLILDRILPSRKGRTVILDLPPVETASDLANAFTAVTTAVAAGNLTPEEGASIAGLLETHRRAIETADLERRLAALEGKESDDENV